MYTNWLPLAVCVLGYFVTTQCLAEPTSEVSGDEEKISEALKVLEHLTETRRGLTALKKIINDIDSDMANTQKRSCLVGGGMSGHCAAAFLSDQIDMHDWLQSGMSPGKKRASESSAVQTPLQKRQTKRDFAELSRKRKGLDILKRILNEMEADLIYEQKRTCQFNLGGHCATESAAYVADHWHYLNSPLSPGRKRRDTRLYKTLLSGKLFQ